MAFSLSCGTRRVEQVIYFLGVRCTRGGGESVPSSFFRPTEMFHVFREKKEKDDEQFLCGYSFANMSLSSFTRILYGTSTFGKRVMNGRKASKVIAKECHYSRGWTLGLINAPKLLTSFPKCRYEWQDRATVWIIWVKAATKQRRRPTWKPGTGRRILFRISDALFSPRNELTRDFFFPKELLIKGTR